MRSSMRSMIVLGALVAVGALSGCMARPDVKLTTAVYAGEHGQARTYLMDRLTTATEDRNYMLDRMRLMMVTMADGHIDHGTPAVEQVYDKLRTQGINADKTVQSVVLNEDLKFWKGEPFEQAMAFCYIATFRGSQGDWAEMRRAADDALFQLRDFGVDDKGNRLDAEALATKAAKANDDAVINSGYQAVRSNFTLGYLLNAVANQQLGRDEEAADNYRMALEVDSTLKSLVDQLKAGKYNTLFIVDYGQGPQKTGTGPDNSIAKFVPQTVSDGKSLVVTSAAGEQRVGQALDLNLIATDLMWNNLEDVRLAKSHIGTALVAAGAGTAAYAAYNQSEAAGYAALGMLVAGAVAKAGAHVDTRYCEIVPQRVYVAPVQINGPADRVTFQIDGRPATTLALTNLAPPKNQRLQVRYVRLVSAAETSPAWATSGQVLYANEFAPGAGTRKLPYILGGDCVRPPSQETLSSYQQAGFLRDMTLAQLENLYRLEGIEWQIEADRQPGMHVLEGGNSLVSPLPGTAGYARLFGQKHGPYQPRSAEVKALWQQVNAAQTVAQN